jgi:thioester reductase-like protein
LDHERPGILAQLRLVEGDITHENLGLSTADLEMVRAEATTIFHLAALYDLAVKRDLALAVNVSGTRNINNLVRMLPHLRRYHYVSTCYVAGKRAGVIAENELRHEAGFRNFYEESKYLAELEVEALKPQFPVTIHRPAVVCGDSRTGETVKFDGVYYLINYLLRMPRPVGLCNIGNQRVSLNLVPVDFVVDAMAALARDEQAIGRTVQIADPAPLTTHELFDTIALTINKSRSRLTIPAPLVEYFLSSPISPPITHLPHHAVPYFFLKQTYDTTQSSELLSRHGLSCPAFPSYVGTIVDYCARHATR